MYPAVEVNCYESEKKQNITFTDIIPIIPKIPQQHNQLPNDVPNILLLGVDSVSRLSFERHMIKLEKLFKEKNFYQLYGYNKVGDNTFPNMVPFYTGFHPIELGFEYETYKGTFDDWPFVWKEYKKLGHVTMFGEVWPEAGTFNYFKPGFTDSPFDVNMRTWALAISSKVRDLMTDNGWRTYKFCIGNQKEIEIYYNFTYDFIVEMDKQKHKYFASVFMGRMTHDSLNNPYFVDEPAYTLISKLFNENRLDNTVVLFYSDHSLRYGYWIWNTLNGKIEARLPMMNIYLPPTFPKEFNISNLIKNKKRLTTPFDIHATLTNIVKGNSMKKKFLYGISLFDEIPVNRTCEDAGIPIQLCGCGLPETINDKRLKQVIGDVMIKNLNQLLEPVKSYCHQLTLGEVKSLYLHTFPRSPVANMTVYTATIEAKPSKGKFDAILRLDHKEHQDNKQIHHENKNSIVQETLSNQDRIKVVGEIIRTDQYGNQSHCITPQVTKIYTLRNYCLCKDL